MLDDRLKRVGRFIVRSDSVPLIRHVAICAAALTAYFMQQRLRVGQGLLWIVGAAALLNLATTVLGDRPRLGRVARILSSVFGLAGWAGIASLTGGVASPLVAGLALEIFLSAVAYRPRGTLLVTAGAVLGLWGQQALVDLSGATLRLLLLQSGLLSGMGAVSLYLSRSWALTLSRSTSEFRRRLQALQNELDGMRTLGKMGEGTARLAHQLANTVHSLRGFTSLLASRLAPGGRDQPVLEGLRESIDQLETLARATLGNGGAARGLPTRATGEQVREVLESVVREIGRRHPGVRWVLPEQEEFPAVSMPPWEVQEVLQVVIQNAAESSGGRGIVQLSFGAQNEQVRFHVQDNGRGVEPGAQQNLYRPGFSTKSGGNGFGLFLTRRLLRSRGGDLSLVPARRRGTVCTVSLPLMGNR
ncbi:MAG: ATP-binding protein [Acidobacteriota bacterium]